MPRYNPASIEPKWQAFWEDNKTFRSPEKPADEKMYVLDMFPYPSGEGLHVGHPEGYTATDIQCRFKRMCGVSVLHPMGFDAFGLPAEEYAIKNNKPPRETTETNIGTFRRQLKSLGFSYDWDREIATTDVAYFKWTQWIFLVLYDTWYDQSAQKGRPIAELPIPDDVQKQGDTAVRKYQDQNRIAYLDDALVNWCPGLGTVLANEEVIDGKSERDSHPVHRIPLQQWMLRITSYAERLGDDLEHVNWSEGIKKLQRDWIGRSTGAEVDFFIGAETEFAAWKSSRQADSFPKQPSDDVLRVYTTRPDTLFGATYMVIAPEHPFVQRLTTAEQKEAVEGYCQAAASKSDRDRQDEKKEKTGVFSGSYAINPVNGKPTPIWIADYVLISYGTGAIMAVPAHDQRDFEFAQQFNIPIVAVVDPPEKSAANRDEVLAGDAVFAGHGTAIHSQAYDGLQTADFKDRITADLTTSGTGSTAINYKLRDWVFCRQRFWGEPFPILKELDADGNWNGMLRPVDQADLPVDLPHLEDFKPHGRPEPPLDKADDDWLYPVIDGVRYKRETNTMPQWAGSCWYYLRFIDPDNDQAFVDPELEKAWMPVDLYIGGAEHAVLHLLYARFWHKVLFDRGYVSGPEPFKSLVNQGMILGEPQFHADRAVYESNQTTFDQLDIKATLNEVIDRNGKDKSTYLLQLKTDQGLVDLDETLVEKRKGKEFLTGTDVPVRSKAEKMSKSRGNVINPDFVVEEYGADSLRLYEMFMGPLEATKPWNMSGVNGVKSFLDRAWRMIVDEVSESFELQDAVKDVEPNEEQLRILHKTIKAVTGDIEKLSYNTAIARMMEFVNFFTSQEQRPLAMMRDFTLLLSPFAPHIGEELWSILGGETTLAYENWPQFDESLAKDAFVEIPVQIMGKVKVKLQVDPELSKEALETAARSDERVVALLAGKTVQKVIVVPGRMVNFVAK